MSAEEKSVRPRFTRRALPAAACAVLMLGIGCSNDEPPPERPPRPVRVVEAERLSAGLPAAFTGTVQSAASSRLSFRVPGKVVERPVDVGERLARGTLVARLDTADYRLRLERARAALERARATAREAEAAYARVRALYADDNASRADLDRSLSAVEQARNGVVEGESGVEIVERELSYTRLQAGGDVRVTDVFVEAGENVQAGQPVVQVMDVEAPLEVEWTVPEQLIGRFSPGLGVKVTFPALAGPEAVGEVVDVGAAPRAGRSAFPVVARLDGADDRLRPGMAARVELVLDSGSTEGDASGPVVLPPEAVAGDPEGAYVFVVEAGSSESGGPRTVRRQSVVLGELRPEGLEIASGLEGGETVVSGGVIFLDDGEEVRLMRGDPLGELPSTAPSAGATP